MSQFASVRMPYDEPATPHEMYDDCQAVGSRLRIPQDRKPRTHGEPVAHPSTSWAVSENAAQLAGRLHLHLD